MHEFRETLRFPAPAPGQVVRIDPSLARLLRKNGLDRGVLRIAARGYVLTSVEYDTAFVHFAPVLRDRACRALPAGCPPLAGPALEVPVNLGRLVIGDLQHLVAFHDPLVPEAAAALELEAVFFPADVILKLVSVQLPGGGAAADVAPAVAAELNDPERRGLVTVALPDPTAALVFTTSAAAGAGELHRWLAGTLPAGTTPDAAAQLSASLFGQWVTVPYAGRELELPPGGGLSAVEFGPGPQRRDLYLLQWRRSPLSA